MLIFCLSFFTYKCIYKRKTLLQIEQIPVDDSSPAAETQMVVPHHRLHPGPPGQAELTGSCSGCNLVVSMEVCKQKNLFPLYRGGGQGHDVSGGGACVWASQSGRSFPSSWCFMCSKYLVMVASSGRFSFSFLFFFTPGEFASALLSDTVPLCNCKLLMRAAVRADLVFLGNLNLSNESNYS